MIPKNIYELALLIKDKNLEAVPCGCLSYADIECSSICPIGGKNMKRGPERCMEFARTVVAKCKRENRKKIKLIKEICK